MDRIKWSKNYTIQQSSDDIICYQVRSIKKYINNWLKSNASNNILEKMPLRAYKYTSLNENV